MNFRESFTPENIERTAESLAGAIPYMRDWEGCTRLDIAVEMCIPCSLLEKAMALSDDLFDAVTLIEERSLAADLMKMPHQINDKHVNASILSRYYEQKYHRTTKVIESLNGVTDKAVTPAINIFSTGKDGSEHIKD